MSENFAQLFEESLNKKKLHSGAIIKATVIAIKNGYVIVNAGLKSEAMISIEEFYDVNGKITVVIGDDVDVAVESLEDGFGETVLSRERAKRFEAWHRLIKAHEDNLTVVGVIVARVKGGFTVEVDSVRAFLPGSLLDVRPLRDSSHLENRPLEFKVVKVDDKRNNIVVSRRAILELESNTERSHLLENISEGSQIKGIVKNLTDYGAFVDLGSIDGLLHITDMSWKRIKHPSQLLNVGDEIEVKVLKFDREKNRVSLGMKQLNEDPWQEVIGHYTVGSRLQGKVTKVTDYGCFVEVEKGIEGLIHMSEMDWTNKNVNPNKVVSVGEEIDVLVLEIDEERRRISLGLKQCKENPWEKFAEKYSKNEKISGKIKSITDFGIFIGLECDIDGLVHLSDISWASAGAEAVSQYQKGQIVEAIILSIDPDKERISLGIKQLSEDSLAKFTKGNLVTGKVIEVEPRQATLDLGNNVIGLLRASEINDVKGVDATTVLKIGDSIEAKITNVDRKNNIINLSIKAKDIQERHEVVRELSNTQARPTWGDLMKKN